MNLIGQEEKENKAEKVKKILKISIISVLVLIIIILSLSFYLSYQYKQKLKLSIDRKIVAIPESTFAFDESKIYVSIQDIAKLVGYDFFFGDYNKLTEDQNKCYVNNKKEVAGFELGSNLMYKLYPTEKNQNYDYYTIDEPVKTINNKLYVSSDALKTACNLTFNFNQQNNTIYIETLNYLFTKKSETVINKYGYSGLDDNFKNQKAILKDLLVVKKQESKDVYKYGVISSDNKQKIGTKYDKLEFIEPTNDFYVTTNKKVGVMSSEGAQKIEPNYQEIKLIDNDIRLYFVQSNNLCGVLDRNGKRVVYIEYNQIGIDSSLYPSNHIKNNMFLFENCIPVKKNNQWGIFDKNGNVLLEAKYDSLGYISGTKKDVAENNLLVVPSVEGIVICKDKKYGIINSTGKIIAPVVFDKIYSVTNLGEDKFYLEYNGQTINLEDYLNQDPNQSNNAYANEITEATTNETVDNQIVNSTVVQQPEVNVNLELPAAQ